MTPCSNPPSCKITIPEFKKILDACPECVSTFQRTADRIGLKYFVETIQ